MKKLNTKGVFALGLAVGIPLTGVTACVMASTHNQNNQGNTVNVLEDGSRAGVKPCYGFK